MNAPKIAALVLLVVGVLLLLSGGIRSMGTTHSVAMGSQEISVTTHRTPDIQLWAGVGLIAIGGALLLVPRWRRERAR
jgi:hypothetical protein